LIKLSLLLFFGCLDSSDATTVQATEGKILELRASGDKSNDGCSFTHLATNCCYVHKLREDVRGDRLCSEAKQPIECRQPGSGEYRVDEISGRVGECRLILNDTRQTDAGSWTIRFPFDGEQPVQKQTVEVLDKAEGSGLPLVLLPVLLLMTLLIGGVKLVMDYKGGRLPYQWWTWLTSALGKIKSGKEVKSELEEMEEGAMGKRNRYYHTPLYEW